MMAVAIIRGRGSRDGQVDLVSIFDRIAHSGDSADLQNGYANAQNNLRGNWSLPDLWFRGHEERVRKHSQHSPLYSPRLVHE